MKQYILKYSNCTAVVEGDIAFNSDGTINYVWSCTDLTIYRNDEITYQSMDRVNSSQAKRRLSGYVLAY